MTPHPQMIDRLASEYVLGTLRGPARRRFERWRASLAPVQERCRFWEEQLLPLAGGLRPMTPAPRLWQGISERLQLTPPRRRVLPVRRAWLPALAAALLLAVGFGAFQYWQAPGPLTQRAMITAPSGQMAWTVEVHAAGLRGAQLVVRPGALPARQSGRDYELWALPAGGSPVSLGVLPVTGGAARHLLSARQLGALVASMQVAVSIEPAGGSPTGQPTGPVVLTAPLSAAS